MHWVEQLLNLGQNSTAVLTCSVTNDSNEGGQGEGSAEHQVFYDSCLQWGNCGVFCFKAHPPGKAKWRDSLKRQKKDIIKYVQNWLRKE